MDPYEILGVEKDATDAAIKSAYRKLARKAHPDNGGNAAAFIEINRAYTVLSDPEQRTLFDASGVIVEDDVFNDQQLVLTTLAMYLEHVLGDGAQRGQSPNERNIVKIMRKMLEDRIYEMDSTARGLKIKRDEYRKLINRIKRKGEGENKFAIIINQIKH